MRLLLDTHVLLWAILQTSKLSSVALRAIRNIDNEICVSSVSLWEISIKWRLNKINLIGLTTSDLIPLAESMGFRLISLEPEEAVTYGDLTENTHFDPFDRMLAWQAIQRELVLVSRDPEFAKFEKDGLRLLWN